MLIEDVRPTTLDGVKRLAVRIRKAQGIKHSLALDLAAKAASCANFRHAQRTLQPGHPVQHFVYLTMYWHDRKQRKSGRETLKIGLPAPVLKIFEKSALKRARGLADLRMVADDHFVCDSLVTSQSYARNQLCAAERSLRFMQHTGLRPSRDHRKAYPGGSVKNELPSGDHTTLWLEPSSGQFVLIDEPYNGAPDERARETWASRHAWKIIKTSWPGMYNPYQCGLYIATYAGSGYDAEGLAAKIDALPAPLVEVDWSGESAPSLETFVSPMATNARDVQRARCQGLIYRVSSSKTLPYSSNSNSRRPAGKMGVAGHIDAGGILKAVLGSKHRPYAAYKRLNSLRSTLEDWMSLEIGTGELEGSDFFEVYYTDCERDAAYREQASSPTAIIAMLDGLKQKLSAHYPDCAPLRRQIHRIDMSVSLILAEKRNDG